MRGFPGACGFHAIIAALGLIAMIAVRPDSGPLITLMTAAVGVSFAVAAAFRAAMEAIAGSRSQFPEGRGDAFTLAGSLSAGSACGTGDVRAVAAVMILAALIAAFRSREMRASVAPVFPGEIDPEPGGQFVMLGIAANDNEKDGQKASPEQGAAQG